MSESALQKKILNWLKASGYYAIKTITVNRAGCPDILACCNGVFVGIEVKVGKNKASVLQEQHVKEIETAGGMSFVAYSLEDVQKALTTSKIFNHQVDMI